VLENNLVSLEKKLNSTERKIKTKSEEIGTLEGTIISLEKKVKNYDEKFSNLNSKIEEQQSVVDQAKKESLDFRNENLQGMDSDSFKQKFLYPELNLLDEKKESKAARLKTIAFTLFILFAGVGLIYAWENFEQPLFLCDDGSAELESYQVLDDVRDCDDGSDEETSSFWSSEDTRAEEFDYSPEVMFAMFRDLGFCCTLGLLGGGIPLLIRVSDSPKVEFESKFDREHAESFAKSDTLGKKHRQENSKLRNLITRKNNLKNSYEEHISKTKALLNSRKKKENLEVELGKIKTAISETQERIEDNWSSISDLVPYGKELL